MARKPSLWHRKSNKQYYTTINGVQYRLGKNKKEAERQFHSMMANPPEASATPVRCDSVAAILDDFLDWTAENRASKTYQGYKDYCESFWKVFPDLHIDELNTGHISTWLSQKKSWNATTKRGAITAMQRAFNWAVKNRGLKRNPIRGMEKPTANRRTTTVSPEEFELILKHTNDQQFRDLLTVSWDCGARPQEVRAIESRHVDLEKRRAVLPTDEAKGKKHPRVIYFPTIRSIEIVSRLCDEHPNGVIFRNTRGNQWTGCAVKCRFAKLEEMTGRRFCQYEFRHTWISRKIVAGVDSHVVAKLAGHTDTSMVDRVYSHAADDYEFMLRQAQKDINSQDA